MSVSLKNYTSIIVQWAAVDCIYQNGDITGFSVQVTVVKTGSVQTVFVLGGSTMEAVIANLMPSTDYYIRVAATNAAGLGVYSEDISVNMPKKSKCFLNREIQ